MRVRCIDDHYPEEGRGELVSAIMKVGDDHLLVKNGQEYTVIGFAHLAGGIQCYELEEIDTISHGYHQKLVFKKERFDVLDTPFEPNAIEEWSGSLCRKMNFYMCFTIKENNNEKQ